MKNNKLPLSVKTEAAVKPTESYTYQDFYQNRLQVPKQLQEEMLGKGLVWRYVNVNEFKKNYGHASHWQPYKPDIKLFDIFGSEDGYLRRGDLILAARPKAMADAHKAILQKKNDQLQRFNKSKAEELRKAVRQAGIDAQITEGYDSESDEE